MKVTESARCHLMEKESRHPATIVAGGKPLDVPVQALIDEAVDTPSREISCRLTRGWLRSVALCYVVRRSHESHCKPSRECVCECELKHITYAHNDITT